MNKPLKVAFRVDSSTEIGTGHLVRCLTLADALAQLGCQCLFLCRNHGGNSASRVTQHGHSLALLAAPNTSPVIGDNISWHGVDAAQDIRESAQVLTRFAADWMIVDHYSFDARWELMIRLYCKRLMVVDDLADRPHDCDLLLDQNLGRSAGDYADLIRPATQILAGPQYALLRPEFAQLRPQSLLRKRSGCFENILVSMGGIDKENVTENVLESIGICLKPGAFRITVVMGEHAPWRNQIRDKAKQMRHRIDVLVGVRNMAQLMADSDLAIGGAGTTAWERCCLGLPTIILVLADNQRAGAAALQKSGAAILAQNANEVCKIFTEAEAGFLAILPALSKAGAAVTDGQGAQRTIKAMLQYD